jgi:hypothetical protein
MIMNINRYIVINIDDLFHMEEYGIHFWYLITGDLRTK